MGQPSNPSGEPSPASEGAASRSRGPGAGRMEATPNRVDQEVCPALADLYHAHYRSLCRLAALLTGDPRAAETVVQDSFVALHRLGARMDTNEASLPYLRRLVVARSRRAARGHRALPGGADGPQRAPRFESSAVVQALRSLSAGQREAVVLTFYLDLSREQAAAAMRVSQITLSHYLTAARTALCAALPANP
jgi:DNA-directed RNA polymerase specialized sigma24 family protein